MVSRFMAINDRFAVNGYSDQLEEKYQAYGYAKLSELLTLPENMAEALPEGLTRKEIQAVKEEYREEKKITDLEVMMEGPAEENEILQIIRGYFKEHPMDYLRIWDEAPRFRTVNDALEQLAPAGSVTIVTRVKGKGKMMLVVDTAKGTAQLVSMRTDQSEAVGAENIAAAVTALCYRPELTDGKAAWAEIFGEPFPEIAPVQKSEKVKTPQKETYTDEGGNTITPAKKPLGDVSEAVPEEITTKQIIGSSPKKELTEEQKYDRQQAKIDKQTKEKLEEIKEANEPLPSEQTQLVHEIKLAELYYEDVAIGKKTFELRKNERGYKVGDALLMTEFAGGRPTGRTIYADIIYILEGYTGLQEGYAILGIKVTRAD
ncbi:MAG: DUF3850 domain-containing protein [Eubacterium sp.]|nr:DUF3850 domain-containing protein [Eubacterium sp.]